MFNFGNLLRRGRITKNIDAKDYITVQKPDASGNFTESAISAEDLKLEVAKSIAHTVPAYRIYTALFTQTGTAIPTATVFENTMNNAVSLGRLGVGEYTIECIDFVRNKTFMSGLSDWWGNGSTVFTISNDSAITGYVSIYYGAWSGGTGRIAVKVYSPTWVLTEWSTIMGDSVFSLPEIKVYD